jgi:hypothetical protein
MARTSTTKTVENVVENVIEENITETTTNTVEKMIEKDKKVEKKSAKVEPLNDSDEIEVVSLVPNVSYKDSRTLDMYEWDEIGHPEYMTFETLKNMWRNNKGYFKNLWLKPNDDRVISKFGLTKTFEKYEYLMDASNYTRANIKAICDAIAETPNGLKFSICDKVKNLVINGEITDVSVIKALENRLKIDLIEFLD